ncbi:hypothetical protein LT330_003675 [Penicillium expansum]|nr:hypothetical protein N7453_003791 [Penicillium expansum]KAK4861640.1 hypothetical protein LT330_003675 [Penicillium expansum]
MKYPISTIAFLATLFSQAIALKSNGVYEIQSPRSGDVWGVQNSIGVKHRVELVHPEGKSAERWRLVSSGPDFFIENIYTQGMLACKHQCEVDTLGNDAQLFKVIQNDDDTFTFHPSGTQLVVAAGEGNDLEAQPSGPSVDAAFVLRLAESKCESL